MRGVGWGKEEEKKVEKEERQEEGEEEGEQSGERRRIIFCGWRGSIVGPAATSDWLLGYYFLPEKHTHN